MENPFSIVFAQALMCFFSLFQVNREIHLPLHREQSEKCILEKEIKVFDADMLISFPTKNLKEGEVWRDDVKVFCLCYFLADFNCPWG